MPVRLVWSCTTMATLPSCADQLGHVLGGLGRGGDVVGGRGGQRDVAVDAGVERDDRDVRRPWPAAAAGRRPGCRARRSRSAPGFLSSAVCSISICCSTLPSSCGALEGDLDVELLAGLLGARLHGLPELVLEALGDERDVRLLVAAAVVRRSPVSAQPVERDGDGGRRRRRPSIMPSLLM